MHFINLAKIIKWWRFAIHSNTVKNHVTRRWMLHQAVNWKLIINLLASRSFCSLSNRDNIRVVRKSSRLLGRPVHKSYRNSTHRGQIRKSSSGEINPISSMWTYIFKIAPSARSNSLRVLGRKSRVFLPLESNVILACILSEKDGKIRARNTEQRTIARKSQRWHVGETINQRNTQLRADHGVRCARTSRCALTSTCNAPYRNAFPNINV